MRADIGWAGLAVSLLLVVVAVALSLWRRLDLERSIVWATARALVQLLAVGVALDLVLDPGRTLAWSWLWVVAMLVIAAAVVRWRAREVPAVFPLALAAFGAAAAITLGVLFGLGVFELEGRTLIPLAGLMTGNSMAATVLVARRVYEELRDKRAEVEARLALGLGSIEAARPYVRNALRTALIPQIETTKAVGLVVLPGSMTGLILAGAEPFDAVRVQAAVMYLILGSVATTTAVVALGVRRRLFTPDHRLVPMERLAEG
ncbi:MAG TPA: iron export ABC transporter permease subunit FetB [Acidimicrobiia bacterium]|nr:iron export ABC transporter permease subunit FetB [Acidimicrobiia bacterium]